MLRLLAAVLSACSASACSAQVRTWGDPTGGAWSDPSNWLGGDAADAPSEVALLDRAAVYAVTLPTAPLSIDSLRVTRGDVTLRPAGAEDATLAAAAGAEVAGALRLGGALAGVRLDLAGPLTLQPGAAVVAQGGSVSASATSLAGGSPIAATLLELHGGTTADLGDLSIGAPGGGTTRAAVDLFAGAATTVGALRIGADDPAVPSELNLIGSSIVQEESSLAVIGQSAAGGPTGRGSVTLLDGADATFGSLEIRDTGRLVSSGSAARVARTLRILGGTLAFRIDPTAPVAAIEVGGAATLGGTLSAGLAPVAGRGFAAGDRFPLVAADSISGAFAGLSVPALPSGLVWRTHQTGTAFSLHVVSPGVAGDFNADGVVNAADYTVWRDSEGSASPWPMADANADGNVGRPDYLTWRAAFGARVGTVSAAVPEPSGVLLATSAFFAVVGGREKRLPA